MPWAALVSVAEPFYCKYETDQPPFGIETMLRVHYLQQWFALSDPAMVEALLDMPVFQEFAKFGDGLARLPDETTILRLRPLLEMHDLATDTLRADTKIL